MLNFKNLFYLLLIFLLQNKFVFSMDPNNQNNIQDNNKDNQEVTLYDIYNNTQEVNKSSLNFARNLKIAEEGKNIDNYINDNIKKELKEIQEEKDPSKLLLLTYQKTNVGILRLENLIRKLDKENSKNINLLIKNDQDSDQKLNKLRRISCITSVFLALSISILTAILSNDKLQEFVIDNLSKD